MKGLFQCPPWARSFCPLPFPSAGDRWFRACGAYLRNLNNKCINLVKDRWADTLRHLQHGRKPMPATWR